MVSLLILCFALIAIAQLFLVATQANLNARSTTVTTALSQQKLEQLRALTWGYDTLGLPASDFVSNTAVSPQASAGGTGLTPSPSNSLTENVPGYVDYLNANGQSLGGGSSPPAGTQYVRRWSVEPLPTNPNNTLILQVLTFRRASARETIGTTTARRLPEEARVVTIKTRKSQ